MAHKLRVSEGDRCSSRLGVPPSTCTKSENCTTLKAYKNLSENVEGCGFYPPYGKELICCPDELPSFEKETTIAPLVTSDELNYNFLASLAYLEPVKMDDFVYRFTALVLSPNLVLATSLSVHQTKNLLPIKVLLGTKDPRVYADTNVEVEIMKTSEYFNDNTLFQLKDHISEDLLRTNVSIAKLCDRDDLSNYRTMSAIGFARNPEDGTSCSIFKQKMHLVDFNNCRNVINKNDVVIDSFGHLCMTPGAEYWTPWEDKRCLKCLIATSSVLQVERLDGSYCVGGIATPTTDDCVVSHDPLYYTIL